MPRLTIDLFSDIACPWCFIGTRRLGQVLAELDGEVEVEVNHHPYLLQPDAPPEGVDLQAQLRERYGTDPLPMFSRVEEAARGAGIELDLSKQRYSYDTTGAHTLLRHAGARGTQGALSDALFSAYFLEARHIADVEVLSEIAAEHGFTAEEASRILSDEQELALTRMEAGDAMRQGVRGVPLFIFNRRYSLSGAQPLEIFHEAIRRSLAEEAQETPAG